jgi:hypothetical protein
MVLYWKIRRWSLVQCHWRTSLVFKCIIPPYLLILGDIHRTDVVTGAKLSTCDAQKTVTYPHTRWDVQLWQRMSRNLVHRRNFSNCLECFDCPWILHLHCYLLELIMSSSIMKNAFIMSLDFTACYTEMAETIWSSLWRHSLNRSLRGVTLKPVCLYLGKPVLLVFHLFWNMWNNWNTKF